MAASAVHVSGGAETYFAKKLASNEKTVRDKAVKKLKTWISTRRSVSSGLTENDMLKLWKGLFYCMWMSDKPKVQEELAETIAKLLHSFQVTTTAVDYLDGFYKTICREWHGIDRLRLDKFYLLIRKFVYQSIAFLKSHSWENEVVEAFNKVLENGPLSTSNESQVVPDGVKTHVIQVYLDELLKCESPQIPHSVLLHLLQPFIQLLATSKSKIISKTVSKEIFDELLKKHQQDGCFLKINIQAMSDEFFSWASRKDIPTRNRNILYEYIEKLKIIPEERDCDSQIQLKQVNGLDESKYNGTVKPSVDNCNSISMDVDGVNECKDHTKKIKKRKERNQAVEGVPSLCDMDLSAVNENVNKKRKRKKETSNQNFTKVENGSKVSVKDGIAICEDNKIKKQHNELLVHDMSTESVEDSKCGEKITCGKRKSCSKATSKESKTMLNNDKESKKKKRKGKPSENKICEETHEGDSVDNQHGKKKKKSKNNSVIQGSIDLMLVESENNMKDKSSEMEVSAHEGSESMNYTSDSLDGSYLSTLPTQARNISSFVENLKKTTERAKVINKKESPVQDTYNTKTVTDTATIDMSTEHSLGEPGVAIPTVTTTHAEEEVIETRKNENLELTPDSMPLSTFLRHSLKKVKANTEPRTQKERKKLAPKSQASFSKKKVRIELSKNTSHTTRDYRRSLKCSPVIPFNADKKPVQSSLKTPPASASNENATNSLQLRKRPGAVDYF